MPATGALAEWLGRGLQSLVRRFESARRLLCKVPEPDTAGEVPDALHLTLVVEAAKIDLGRLDLRVVQQPLERFEFAGVRFQEVRCRGRSEGVGVNLLAGASS